MERNSGSGMGRASSKKQHNNDRKKMEALFDRLRRNPKLLDSFERVDLERSESLVLPGSLVKHETSSEEIEDPMNIDAAFKGSYIVGADGIPAMPLDWRKDNILWPFQDISDNDKDLWKDVPAHYTDAEPNTTTYALAGFFASASEKRLDQALVDEVRNIIRESAWMTSRKHQYIHILVIHLQMKALSALREQVKELKGFRKALTSKP